MATYHLYRAIREVIPCPACGGSRDLRGDVCSSCRGFGMVEGPDVTCPEPRCRLALTSLWEPDPNCRTCGGSGVRGESRHWSQLSWTSKPTWLTNPRRPDFGPRATPGRPLPGDQLVRVVSLDDERNSYEGYETVNLRADPTHPFYQRASPVVVVERDIPGARVKRIRFSEFYDERKSSYRDVRVIRFPL